MRANVMTLIRGISSHCFYGRKHSKLKTIHLNSDYWKRVHRLLVTAQNMLGIACQLKDKPDKELRN